MKDIQEIILGVAQGNPGAMTVIRELQWFNHWYEMLQFCLKKEYVGGRLWSMWKDDFHMSNHDFGNWLNQETLKDKEFEHLQNPQSKIPLKFITPFK